MFALPYFEHQLVMYVTSDDKDNFDTPFDISKIPIVTREQADAEDRTKKLTATTPTLKAPKVDAVKAPATGAEAAASASAQAQRYNEELMQIDEMKEFGSVLKSSPAVELTEAETEYVVSVVKHIFKEHIVLQFEIKNTLPDTVLDNVSVLATPADDEELEEVFIIQCDRLATNEPGKVYVAFKKVGGEGTMPTASFSNVLKFTSKEIDPSTNTPDEPGYDDEYEVSEFDLSGSDYIIPTFASNFSHLWEQVGASGDEAEETLQLSAMKSIAGKYKRWILAREFTLTHCLQRLPSNWPKLCRCSRLKEPTFLSTLAHTRSSYWARLWAEVESLRQCAWHFPQSRESQPRLPSEVKRRVWRRWLLHRWLKKMEEGWRCG